MQCDRPMGLSPVWKKLDRLFCLDCSGPSVDGLVSVDGLGPRLAPNRTDGLLSVYSYAPLSPYFQHDYLLPTACLRFSAFRQSSRSCPAFARNLDSRFDRRNSHPHPLDTVHAIGRYPLSHRQYGPDSAPFECLSGSTYARRGGKAVWTKAIKSGWDNWWETLMFTAFVDGVTRVKSIIIIKGAEKKDRQ